MTPNDSTISQPEELFKEAKLIKSKSVEKAIIMAQQALTLAQGLGDFNLAFDIFLFLGRIFRMQGGAFASIEQLNKAYRLLNHHFSQDKIKLSRIYREYGSLYSDSFGDHAVALDYLRRSLSLNNPEIMTALYNNIGCQYVLLQEYDKATHYLLKGKEICLEQADHNILSFIYENFGQMYLQQGNKLESIKAYQSGMKSAIDSIALSGDTQETNYIYCYNLIGLAKVSLDFGELDRVPGLISKIYDKSNTFKLNGCWSEAAIIEGSMFLRNKETVAFMELFERAVIFCSENNLYRDKEVWLKKVIDLCERQDQYKKALEYSKMLIANKAERESKTKAVNIAKVLENKEMEILALENRNREMQLQKDQLEQFAYIVAHDLKTPLSNISNFVGLFSRKYRNEIDEKNRHYLDFVLNSSRQLHLMFDELLRYITVKEVNDGITDCDVEELASQIKERHHKKIAARNGSIEINALSKVKIYAPHLEILLDRMIENGVKFSREDKDLHILIEVEENLEEYQFFISDNGIGIKEAYRQKIFDLFKQLDKINYKGIGMGLAICKKIVNIYGGEISVSTNQWGGATFEFNIPK